MQYVHIVVKFVEFNLFNKHMRILYNEQLLKRRFYEKSVTRN